MVGLGAYDLRLMATARRRDLTLLAGGERLADLEHDGHPGQDAQALDVFQRLPAVRLGDRVEGPAQVVDVDHCVLLGVVGPDLEEGLPGRRLRGAREAGRCGDESVGRPLPATGYLGLDTRGTPRAKRRLPGSWRRLLEPLGTCPQLRSSSTVATVPATALTPNEALLLVNRVGQDRSLEERYRRRASRLLARVDEPALVLRRLQQSAREALPTLPRTAPTAALVRAVTAGAFWQHHAQPVVRDSFLTGEDFARYVGTAPDPGDTLRHFLAPNPLLVEWQWSWLAELVHIRALTGTQISQALELNQSPPLVLFIFAREDLLREGVTVRKPNSLDSVLGPHLQWRAGGPLSGVREYVDGSVPLAALSTIE